MSIPTQHIWIEDSSEPRGPYLTEVLVDQALEEEIKSTYRLIIFIEPGRLRYVLHTPRGAWIKAKSFESTGLLSDEMFLRFLFEQEKLLGDSFVEVQVYQLKAAFVLVPNPWYEPKQVAAMGRLLLDSQLFPDEVYSYELPFLEAHLLSIFQPELRHILDHYIRDYEFLHPASILLSLGQRQSSKGVEAFALFVGEWMMLALFQDASLLFANMFTCRTAADVLYFLSLARQSAGLSRTPLKAYHMGEHPGITNHLIDWEAYGITWSGAELPQVPNMDGEWGRDLTVWRYLVL